MYDIVIIGAGVTGCAIARELSRYQARICVLEKGDDVCSGTSKANSGVIHSGFDAKPGTLMAKLNVEGNKLMWKWAKELDFPVKQNGALVVCTEPQERGGLDALLEQAVKNGVEGVRILEKDEVMAMEPNLTEKTVAALYAPTGGIICPFQFTIAMAENACSNGVDFKFETEVRDIIKGDEGYEIVTEREMIKSRCVINAAGVYADVLHNKVSNLKIHITARKGEYLLMDKTLGNLFHASVFPQPGRMGKGILTAPTIHGNLYVGPTADDVEDKQATDTTQDTIQLLLEKMVSHHLAKQVLPRDKVITSFAGLRAHEDHKEFIVQEVEDAEGFFDAAGIESPGLTSAPAIGVMMAGLVSEKYGLKRKDSFIGTRKGFIHFSELGNEEKAALIRERPEYGRVVCRCEMVTEGEVMDAINRPLGATSMDGIKRRVRAGMGRCQAGFCTPRTMEILARELGTDMTEITKKGTGSNLLVGRIKQ